MRTKIAIALLSLGLSNAALAKGSKAGTPAEPDRPLDVSASKDKLRALGDGKGHYLIVDGDKLDDELYFYGDGKRMFQQRIIGGGGEQDKEGHWKKKDVVFWEPRVKARYQASIALDNGKWIVRCQERKTELTPLSEAESKQLIDKAQFAKPRWNHRAWRLARDNKGRYYYVDRVREPEENRSFRLFMGLQGDLKPMQMVNVVSDSEGEIFSTKAGDLRLVLNKDQFTWEHGKSKLPLVNVPIEDNAVLIYTDLGVYTGQPLGTPCDDL